MLVLVVILQVAEVDTDIVVAVVAVVVGIAGYMDHAAAVHIVVGDIVVVHIVVVVVVVVD